MSVDFSIFGPLRTFEVAGRLANFTRAAEALHLTQSAVSQQIRQLEERLGYPLFIRHTRGLQLTSKGSELLKSVQSGFSDIASTMIRLDPKGPTTLEVNCLPSLALHWLVPRLTTYYQQHPEAPLRITADLRTVDEQRMEDEGIDVSIRYEPLEQAASNASILFDEYLCPIATPEYLAEHPELQENGPCNGVTFLHDASPWSGAPQFVEWQLWMNTYRPSWLGRLVGPQFNLASMMMSAALNHQGVALGRTAIVSDYLKSGRLIEISGSYLRALASYVLLYRPSSRERSVAFCKWMRSEAAAFDLDRHRLFPALNTLKPRRA